MAQEITIPRLGWSMEEGMFGEWLKTPGEYVRAGEMLFLLEGEKAAQEIEAVDSGYLYVPDDAPSPGALVKVGQRIGILLAEGEVPPSIPVGESRCDLPVSRSATSPQIPIAATGSAAIRAAIPFVAGTTPRVAGPAARRLARELGIDLNSVFTPDPTGRVLCEDIQRTAESQGRSVQPAGSSPIATPRARRSARSLGVDWTTFAGTGRNGRIRERDVLAQHNANTGHTPESLAPGKHTPASKLRRILARRMLEAVTQAAPVTLTTKVDAAPLVAHRAKLKALALEGQTPSYNDILIGLSAQTLRALPELNACWYRDGIHAFDAIHISTAVDTPAGLLAPVIRHADQWSIAQIAEQTRQLIAQARAGRLNQTALEGGTFTVTNLGMFGIDTFTPILNLPQAGILGIGRIVDEPVVRAGRLEAGSTLTLSLTFDHRVIDGAPAARWLQYLCQLIAQLPIA